MVFSVHEGIFGVVSNWQVTCKLLAVTSGWKAGEWEKKGIRWLQVATNDQNNGEARRALGLNIQTWSKIDSTLVVDSTQHIGYHSNIYKTIFDSARI